MLSVQGRCVDACSNFAARFTSVIPPEVLAENVVTDEFNEDFGSPNSCFLGILRRKVPTVFFRF